MVKGIHKTQGKLIRLALLLVSLVVCMGYGASLAFSSESDVPSVMLIEDASDEFTVELPSNPTTGFKLQVKTYDHQALQLEKSEFIPPTSKLIGAGGIMRFTFKRLNSAVKSTKIEVENARPWDPSSAISSVVLIRFKS